MTVPLESDAGMTDIFDLCAAFTYREEGGYTCRREDAGNWSEGVVGRGDLIGSNRGISAPTLIAWNGYADARDRQVAAMKSLDDPTFMAIARTRYWRGLGCAGLPGPVAFMTFDFGFNAGVNRAGRLLQQMLGMPAADVDGDVGPKTQLWASTPRWRSIASDLPAAAIVALQKECAVAADGIAGEVLLAALERRSELWPTALATAMATRQRAAYRSFAGFDVFGSGWLARAARRLDAALNLPQGPLPRT